MFNHFFGTTADIALAMPLSGTCLIPGSPLFRACHMLKLPFAWPGISITGVYATRRVKKLCGYLITKDEGIKPLSGFDHDVTVQRVGCDNLPQGFLLPVGGARQTSCTGMHQGRHNCRYFRRTSAVKRQGVAFDRGLTRGLALKLAGPKRSHLLIKHLITESKIGSRRPPIDAYRVLG
jgi:hypothetical protein